MFGNLLLYNSFGEYRVLRRFSVVAHNCSVYDDPIFCLLVNPPGLCDISVLKSHWLCSCFLRGLISYQLNE